MLFSPPRVLCSSWEPSVPCGSSACHLVPWHLPTPTRSIARGSPEVAPECSPVSCSVWSMLSVSWMTGIASPRPHKGAQDCRDGSMRGPITTAHDSFFGVWWRSLRYSQPISLSAVFPTSNPVFFFFMYLSNSTVAKGKRRRKERGRKREEEKEKSKRKRRRKIRKPSPCCHFGLFPFRFFFCASVLYCHFFLTQWCPQSNLVACLSQVISCNFFLYKIYSQSSVALLARANTYISCSSIVIRPRMDACDLWGRRPCALSLWLEDLKDDLFWILVPDCAC